jgi:hypothetical protein
VVERLWESNGNAPFDCGRVPWSERRVSMPHLPVLFIGEAQIALHPGLHQLVDLVTRKGPLALRCAA